MTFFRGRPYLPGVEELISPVFKDILLNLQEAHPCTSEETFMHNLKHVMTLHLTGHLNERRP